jgi:hypothetical protein
MAQPPKPSDVTPPHPSTNTALVPSAHKTTGSGSALQAAPKHRKERIVRIEINSNDRDFSTYPNPAQFAWECPYPLKNIVSMVIVGGTIPVPLYTIDTPFNSFTFDTGTKITTLTLPPGLYTPILFAPKFKYVIDAADGVNTYTVKVEPISQILHVTSSGMNRFGFLFGSGDFKNEYSPSLTKVNNPARQLGFLDKDYYSVNKTICAPFPVVLNPVQRIYLYMNYDTSIDLHSVILAGGRLSPSAILYCTDQDTVSYYTKSLNKDTYENVITPGTMVSRIRTINITLRDEFGNLLNLNNRPVSLLLEVSVID